MINTTDIQQTNLASGNVHSKPLRFFAHVLSYLFHPLFIPIYVFYFLEFIHPSYFVGFGDLGKKKLMLLIVINAVLFPAITVFLLRKLNFIKSFLLETQQDRIIPYITSMIFFFWTYYVLREQNSIPRIGVVFMFGVFISVSAALIANIYFKISMHAIGMGGLVGLFLIIAHGSTMLMTAPLCVAFLLTGLVCTARLIVSNHSPFEIYTGLLAGLLCQVLGAIIFL